MCWQGVLRCDITFVYCYQYWLNVFMIWYYIVVCVDWVFLHYDIIILFLLTGCFFYDMILYCCLYWQCVLMVCYYIVDWVVLRYDIVVCVDWVFLRYEIVVCVFYGNILLFLLTVFFPYLLWRFVVILLGKLSQLKDLY